MSSDAHGATVPAGHGLHHPYHLVNPSPWPIVGALGGLCTVLGIIFAAHFGSYVMLVIGAVFVPTGLGHEAWRVRRLGDRSDRPGARQSALVRRPGLQPVVFEYYVVHKGAARSVG